MGKQLVQAAQGLCQASCLVLRRAGRCEMAASLGAEELGSSFAIQSYGDLAARHAPVLFILLQHPCHVICVANSLLHTESSVPY